MFYIRHNKTGLFMSGYCRWVDGTQHALAFSSAPGVEAVAEMLRHSGVSITVVSDWEAHDEVTVAI